MSGRWAFGLTTAAFAWGVALIVAAFVAPAYSVDSGSGGQQTTTTLVDENGMSVLVVVAIPAVIAAIVWAVLHRRRTTGRSAGAAWVLVAVLGVFSVLSLASIGIFILPVVAMLALAAKLTPSPVLG
jgi:hypothetical protein